MGARRLTFLVVLALLVIAAPFVLSSYWVGLLTEVAILAILAMSLDVLLGYTGLPSLGHASLFGVAAYAVALLSTRYGMNFWTCVFAGLVVGWIHKPVALGVERSYGKGRMAASTFRLFRDAPMADPTATMLLDGLVELVAESREARIEEKVRGAEAAA